MEKLQRSFQRIRGDRRSIGGGVFIVAGGLWKIVEWAGDFDFLVSLADRMSLDALAQWGWLGLIVFGVIWLWYIANHIPPVRFSLPSELTGSYIRGQTFRLVDLMVGGSDGIHGRTFEDCTIYGPAVIATFGVGQISYCRFIQSDFFRVDEGARIPGTIPVVDCTLRRCDLINLGMVGVEEDIERWKSGSMSVDFKSTSDLRDVPEVDTDTPKK